MTDINIHKEIQEIDKRLIEMREEYLAATPNRRRLIAVAANLYKERRLRLMKGLA